MGGRWIKRQEPRALSALVVAALVAAGCGLSDRSTAPAAPAALRLALSFGEEGAATSIDSVDLVIRHPEGDSTVEVLRLDKGTVRDTVFIEPGDSLTFVLRAFGADGRLLYIGSAGPMNVPSGAPVRVEILLEPAILMLRPGPMYQESRLGSSGTVTVYVDVHKVDSLFGASFRLTWDPSILQLRNAVEGDFLQNSEAEIPTIFFVETNNELGFAACGVTRGGSPNVFIPGVSGSGCLATFQFDKVGVGLSPIQFATEQRVGPRLTKPDGGFVDGFEGLFLESATVRVVDGGRGH
ncbi:MAG TPA: cohesin domain-containing protein [Acidobacteriota bacterium]|nr:cohesin domain-containing protein [Acidobacteriota bacterium]